MPVIQFPSNLDKSNSPYIIITGKRWGTKYKKHKSAKQTDGNEYITISLPMPTNGLTDSTDHEWNQTEGALLNLSKANAGKMVLKGALESLKQSLGSMVAAQQYSQGQTINDFASMTYGGQGFRQFSFEFDLTPNNAGDAKKINEIVKLFKKGSLPINAGSILHYPYFWIIQAFKPSGELYFDIKKSVINNFTVNRFQDGEATVHPDGEPIKTNISISFTELLREWNSDY